MSYRDIIAPSALTILAIACASYLAGDLIANPTMDGAVVATIIGVVAITSILCTLMVGVIVTDAAATRRYRRETAARDAAIAASEYPLPDLSGWGTADPAWLGEKVFADRW
jgi:hypothetical protein